MQRGGGVLMHIASLPGPFGIGVLGEEAVAYAKQLKKQGISPTNANVRKIIEAKKVDNIINPSKMKS